MPLSPSRFADVVVLAVSGRIDHATSEAARPAGPAPHAARPRPGRCRRMRLVLAGTELAKRYGYARTGDRSPVAVELRVPA